MAGKRTRPLVLIIDDVPPVVRIIDIELRSQGFDLVGTPMGANIYDLIEELAPDLVLLEVFLPQLSGLEVLREIKERFQIPVVFLTTSDRPGDEREAFELGADDFIRKPFDPEDLSERIRNLIGLRGPGAAEIRGAGIAIHPGDRTVTRNGEEIDLSTNEWALLLVLASAHGQTLDANTILSRVWGAEGAINQNTLVVWIARLNDRLGSEAIIGDPENGFRFNLDPD
jgi:two-component system KDP operon response regulator KdpE